MGNTLPQARVRNLAHLGAENEREFGFESVTTIRAERDRALPPAHGAPAGLAHPARRKDRDYVSLFHSWV